jgi:cell division protein FtsI/penicillin-binding protein 2
MEAITKVETFLRNVRRIAGSAAGVRWEAVRCWNLNWGRLLFVILLPDLASAQMPTASPTAAASPSAEEETIVPTFETQKLARTYILDIPAPRGQITDRYGAPLAQNRLSYNLAITFPTPLDLSDAQALDFTREKIAKAEKLIDRPIKISDEAILRHYRNRGILPFEIAQNLKQSQYEEIKDRLPAGVSVRPIYVRTYPNGKVAGQIVGYSGKTGRNPDGIIDNHETLWPETEGREGLEQTFNDLLTGKRGEFKLTFDKDGRKTSEKLVTPPVPGYTVVTTLDLRLQELAEKTLEAKAKRGAIVIVDPNNGDILAMASWPTYDPNLFVPSISPETSRRCRMILTFHCCPARSDLLTRPARPSRSRSAWPRSKVVSFDRMICINAFLRLKLAT